MAGQTAESAGEDKGVGIFRRGSWRLRAFLKVFERKLAALEARVAGLEDNIRQWSTFYAQREREVRELLGALKGEFDARADLLVAQAKRVDAMQKTLEKDTKFLGDTFKKLPRLDAGLQKLKEDLGSLKRGYAELQKNLAKRAEKYEKEQSAIGATLQKVDVRLASMDKSAQEHVAALTKLCEQLREGLQRCEARFEELAKEHGEKIEAVKSARDALEKDLLRLGNELAAAKAHRKKLDESIGGLRESSREQYEALKIELEELRKRKEFVCPFEGRAYAIYPFTAIVGQEAMKKALILNAINSAISGVLLWGLRGNGKTTAIRGLAELFPASAESCEPCELNEKGSQSCTTCDLRFKKGLLSLASEFTGYRGRYRAEYLVDLATNAAMLNLDLGSAEYLQLILPPAQVPPLLGTITFKLRVEPLRDPEERYEVLRRQTEFADNPEKFRDKYKPEQERLRRKLARARERLPYVAVPENAYKMVSELCVTSGRGVLVTNLAKALAAYEGQKEVAISHVVEAAAIGTPETVRKPPAL